MQMLSIQFWIAPSLPETHTENCSYQAIAGWRLFFIPITLVKYIAILLKYHLSFTFFEEAHNSGFCLPVLQRAKFPCCGWLLAGCSLPVQAESPSEPQHGSLWPDSSHQLHKRLTHAFCTVPGDGYPWEGEQEQDSPAGHSDLSPTQLLTWSRQKHLQPNLVLTTAFWQSFLCTSQGERSLTDAAELHTLLLPVFHGKYNLRWEHKLQPDGSKIAAVLQNKKETRRNI